MWILQLLYFTCSVFFLYVIISYQNLIGYYLKFGLFIIPCFYISLRNISAVRFKIIFFYLICTLEADQ